MVNISKNQCKSKCVLSVYQNVKWLIILKFLLICKQVRQHLARLPSIDPNTRTILLCGFPNVGKSSFINKVSQNDILIIITYFVSYWSELIIVLIIVVTLIILMSMYLLIKFIIYLLTQITRADVEVQPYAFTTKSLFVGHTDYSTLRYQVGCCAKTFKINSTGATICKCYLLLYCTCYVIKNINFNINYKWHLIDHEVFKTYQIAKCWLTVLNWNRSVRWHFQTRVIILILYAVPDKRLHVIVIVNNILFPS